MSHETSKTVCERYFRLDCGSNCPLLISVCSIDSQKLKEGKSSQMNGFGLVHWKWAAEFVFSKWNTACFHISFCISSDWLKVTAADEFLLVLLESVCVCVWKCTWFTVSPGSTCSYASLCPWVKETVHSKMKMKINSSPTCPFKPGLFSFLCEKHNSFLHTVTHKKKYHNCSPYHFIYIFDYYIFHFKFDFSNFFI